MDEANVQKTFVCTFIGHPEIYDWATFGDFLVNLEMLLDQHQEVEFLVYWRQKSFKQLYDIISLVILSDEKYQDRKITITQVAEKGRQKMMSLLTEEAALEEIVQMVGMDALSPIDRLKMEAGHPRYALTAVVH